MHNERPSAQELRREGYSQVLVVLIVLTLIVVVLFLVASRDPRIRHPQSLTDKPLFLFKLGEDERQPFKQPMAVDVAKDGSIYVSDTGNHRIRVFDSLGKAVLSFGAYGVKAGQFDYPFGLVVLDNNNILVADSGKQKIEEYTGRGNFVKTWLDPKSGVKPGAMTIGPEGLVYVSDLSGHQVLVLDQAGKSVGKIKDPIINLRFPLGLALDKGGNLWVADAGNFVLRKFDSRGKLVGTFAGVDDPRAGRIVRFTMVRSLAVDRLGRLLVCDTLSNTIHFIDESGRELTSIANSEKGNLYYPMGVNVDKQGRIFVTNRGNDEVQVWGYR